MLAARRFTSHSNGPGRVSSKSLASKSKGPFGRGEPAEVEQVSVPAELDAELRPGVAARSVATAPRPSEKVKGLAAMRP